MRTAIAASCVMLWAAVAAAGASAVPPPLTPEVSVSSPAYMVAAGRQNGVIAASNGEVTLAVWNEARLGGQQIFASRVAGDGHPLDPLGIPLGLDAASAVLWNGDSFSVLGISANTYVVVRVSREGRIDGRTATPMTLPASFIAVTGHGAAARFLFLAGGGAVAFDSSGRVAGGTFSSIFPRQRNVYAGTDSGVAILTDDIGSNVPTRVYFGRLDRDGNVVQPLDLTGLPFTRFTGAETITAGGNGFLVTRQEWQGANPGLFAYRLDENGTYQGQMVTLASPAQPGSLPSYSPAAVAWDGSRWIVSWRTATIKSHATVFLASVDADVTAAQSRAIQDVVGDIRSVSLVRDVAAPLVFTTAQLLYTLSEDDVFAQRFAPNLEAQPREVVAFSGTPQREVQVAALPNGYAVAWAEAGPDAFVHRFVRRFTTSGAPFDPEPLEFARGVSSAPGGSGTESSGALSPPMRLLSAGTSCALVWSPGYGQPILVRRLADTPGEWRDAHPLQTSMYSGYAPFAVASDGRDLMIVGFTQTGVTSSFAAQRIVLEPEMAASPAQPLPKPTGVREVALASDGNDYLVVWSDGIASSVICGCLPPPARVVAVRIRGDGTAVDRDPIIIEGFAPTWSYSVALSPAVAWNGGRYVIAWVGSAVKAAIVTPDGTLRDADPVNGGTVVLTPTTVAGQTVTPAAVKAVALGDGFALLIKLTQYRTSAASAASRWEAVAFCGTCALTEVGALPRTVVVEQTGSDSSFDASAEGAALVVGYDRNAGAESGWVTRAFSRLFAPLARRRSGIE